MKLNLLPTTVARHVQSKLVFVVMLLLVVASLAAAFLVQRDVASDLKNLKEKAEPKVQNANQVRARAAYADEIIAKARVVLTNTALVNQIDDSNKAYADLYDDLMPYIPSFFRVRSLSAQSQGDTALVTITGYLKTFQQYSDVMIALLRFEDATAVGRGNFAPVAPGNEEQFGYSTVTTDRGPIPGWSGVTLTLTVSRDLRAPDPEPTLRAAGTGAAPSQPSTPGGAAGGRTGPPGRP